MCSEREKDSDKKKPGVSIRKKKKRRGRIVWSTSLRVLDGPNLLHTLLFYKNIFI